MLIGTPGRLIDYLKQRVYSLAKTQFLIIDEADRLFDMGFIKDIRFILRRMPPYDKRQSMLFSATLSRRVLELCYEHMDIKKKISISPEQVTVEKIKQEVYHVGLSEKTGLLLGIIKSEENGKFLVFCNTKAAVERLDRLLNFNGHKTAAITGDLNQKKRMKVLSDFKDGTLNILFATDVASRGIHIDGVTHVINYDLPGDPEYYVHRIGRTARAGAEGRAITLACEKYVHTLPDIEDYIKLKIEVVPVTDDIIETDYKIPPRPAFKKTHAFRGKTSHNTGSRKKPQGKGNFSRKRRKPAYKVHSKKPAGGRK